MLLRAVEIIEADPRAYIGQWLRLLVDDIHVGLAAVSSRVIVPHDTDRAESLLRAEIPSALFEVVVEQVSEEGGPMIVQHPVDRHFAVRPVSRVGLVLG